MLIDEQTKRLIKTSGVLLLAGAIIVICTIIIEKFIGWPPDGGQAERISLIIEQWAVLKWLWAGQMFACLLFLFSAILLLSTNYLEKLRPHSTLLFAINSSGAVCAIIAFALTLGSYPPALSVSDSEPNLLNTITGGIRTTYNLGMNLMGISYLILFLRESLNTNGIVSRIFLYAFILMTILLFMLAYIGHLPSRTAGGVAFLIPAFLGWGFIRHVK